MNTAGSYTITASGAEVDGNYTIDYVNGTLTVYDRSGGGSYTQPTVTPDEEEIKDETDVDQVRDSLPEAKEKGTKLTDDKSSATYKVSSTDSNNPTVAYTGSTDKKAKSITIPKSIEVDGVTYKVTSIAGGAFKGNKTVKTITIPNTVTTIGANAFKNCSSLKKLTLSSKVKKIGEKAFSGCKNMKTLTIKSKNLTSKNISDDAFKGITKATTIKVPKSKVSAYKKLFKKKGLSSKVKVTK
jgi:hypothetical protein